MTERFLYGRTLILNFNKPGVHTLFGVRQASESQQHPLTPGSIVEHLLVMSAKDYGRPWERGLLPKRTTPTQRPADGHRVAHIHGGVVLLAIEGGLQRDGGAVTGARLESEASRRLDRGHPRDSKATTYPDFVMAAPFT